MAFYDTASWKRAFTTPPSYTGNTPKGWTDTHTPHPANRPPSPACDAGGSQKSQEKAKYKLLRELSKNECLLGWAEKAGDELGSGQQAGLSLGVDSGREQREKRGNGVHRGPVRVLARGTGGSETGEGWAGLPAPLAMGGHTPRPQFFPGWSSQHTLLPESVTLPSTVVPTSHAFPLFQKSTHPSRFESYPVSILSPSCAQGPSRSWRPQGTCYCITRFPKHTSPKLLTLILCSLCLLITQKHPWRGNATVLEGESQTCKLPTPPQIISDGLLCISGCGWQEMQLSSGFYSFRPEGTKPAGKEAFISA